MAKYLVTGGAGFIGSHISEALVKRGETVTILDNLSTGKKENISSFEDKVSFYHGDICDQEIVAKALKEVEIVFHQAAIPSVPRSIKDPRESHRTNVDGTFNLLFMAKQAGIKRVIYASSSSVYGDTQEILKTETLIPSPISPYAASKLIGEYYCRVFTKSFGLETVCLRYFNVFGHRQDPNSQYSAVIPKFITALLSGASPTIFGDGEQTRDFTYIENVVQANLLAAKTNGVAGKVFNVACGEKISLNSLYFMLAEILGSDIKPIYTDPRPGDVRHSQANIDQIRKNLGYSPNIGVKEGLQMVVKWYREYLKASSKPVLHGNH